LSLGPLLALVFAVAWQAKSPNETRANTRVSD
jgi:hypothetical protein